MLAPCAPRPAISTQVVAPFLLGDLLLFVTGTVFANAGVDVRGTALTPLAAAVLGDATNCAMGRTLAAMHCYFERFGASTIIIARLVPVVRALAPFQAGAGSMQYTHFFAFNLVGAEAWLLSLFYGSVAQGQHLSPRGHISGTTLAIAALSAVPVVLGALRAQRAAVASEN